MHNCSRPFGQPSRRTTFHSLRQVPYLRSYNHNGRFYTARAPARFARCGLFWLGAADVSRDGSLAATVQRLLGASAKDRPAAYNSAPAN